MYNTHSNKKKDFFLDLLIDGRYRKFRHCFIILVFFLFWGILGALAKKEYAGLHNLWQSLFFCVLLLFMFYCNFYVLIPKILSRKRYISYLFSVLVLTIIGAGIFRLYQYYVSEPNRIIPAQYDVGFLVIAAFFSFVMIPTLLCTTALKLFQMWTVETDRILDLEKRAHQNELDALRNQINPHFLFNMLNNINVLIYKQPETASTIIVKLSDFLRYLLYESTDNTVYLKSEIKFLTDFVNLENIRRDDFTFDIVTDDKCNKGIQVPPNIFITFVENAVKHSRDTSGGTFVKMSFTVKDNFLIFNVSNNKRINKQIEDSAGLGLINIKRRLELMYKDDFQLEIIEDDANYTVNLKLPI